MKSLAVILASCSFFFLTVAEKSSPYISDIRKTTADRIIEHGYPAEEHEVKTDDGYIVTVFRIPYSPKLQNNETIKPVVLLQHGLLSASDCFILNGPDNAIAFMLSDAGYDVWLGNSRGNTYGRAHTKLSVNHPYFWRFSWHEIAVYDVAAEIDFALKKSEQSALHYIGHSQGTTGFLVLMAVRPQYNAKIKTSHLLAPVGYAAHMEGALIENGAKYLGEPGIWSALFGSAEFIPRSEFIQDMAFKVCGSNSKYPKYCSDLFFLWAGSDLVNLNLTILPLVAETHPAGISSDQLLHYVQEYASHHFRMFDFGSKKNLKYYNRTTPPDYDVEKITANVYLYVGKNDGSANPTDVETLAAQLPNVRGNFLIDDETWSHLDFIFADQVKEVINKKVIQFCDDYESDYVSG